MAQAANALVQLAHHVRQFALSLLSLTLQASDLVLDSAELLVDGSHKALELLSALGHLSSTALLLGTALIGQALRQRIPGLLEHVGGDRLHFVAHPLTGIGGDGVELLAYALAAGARKRRGDSGAGQGAHDQTGYQQCNGHVSSLFMLVGATR